MWKNSACSIRSKISEPPLCPKIFPCNKPYRWWFLAMLPRYSSLQASVVFGSSRSFFVALKTLRFVILAVEGIFRIFLHSHTSKAMSFWLSSHWLSRICTIQESGKRRYMTVALLEVLKKAIIWLNVNMNVSIRAFISWALCHSSLLLWLNKSKHNCDIFFPLCFDKKLITAAPIVEFYRFLSIL